MKQFAVAAQRKQAEDLDGAEPITFKVGEREVTAIPPSSSQFFLVMAAMGSPSATTRANGVKTFLDSIFEGGDSLYLGRLMEQGLIEVADINEIVGWLIDEWSNPPQVDETESNGESSPSTRSDDSSPSAGRTGRKSTGKQRSKA